MKKLLNHISKAPLIFGGASISGEGKGYGFGDIKENDALDLLLYAKDHNINIYDTAPIYGFGLSEKRIGMAFKKCREEVFLISKSGVTWHPNMRVDMSNDPKITQKMLEESLRNMDTEYIDLYMIHWPDQKVDIRRPLEVLSKAKHEGKIKHIGLCNTFEKDIIKASEVDEIEAIQNQLNVFDRGGLDCVEDYIRLNELSFMSWGTLDKGIVSGTANKDRKYDKSDARSWAPWWKKSNYREKMEKMEKVFPYLESIGRSGIDFAFSYNLSFPEVSHVLCGMRSIAQFDSAYKATHNLMSDNEITTALEILNES